MRKWLAGCIVIILLHGTLVKVQAQDSYADRVNNYIVKYNSLAITEQTIYGIPAAVILAQGILETEAGASELATEANNHFGIKCKSDWKGPTFEHTDDAPNECFRKYSSAEESYRDHSIYLSTTPRYGSLFSIAPTDYRAWAKGLKRCGYATSPTYSQRLIKIIEDFNLQTYTLMAINKSMNKPYNSEENTYTASTTANKHTTDNEPERTVKQKATDETENNKTVDHKYVAGEEITVNGLRAIYAFKGESLLQYAVKYGIRYERLLELNDLPDAPLPCNMYVYLEKKNFRGTHETHIVKPGETLQQISQLEGIQLRRLMMLNHITKMGMEPNTGTVLELQKMADVKPKMYYAGSNKYNSETTDNYPPQYQQTTTKTSEYIYKTTTTSVTTAPVQNTQQTTAPEQKPFVQQPTASLTTTLPVATSTVNVTNEKVTYIHVDKNSTTITEPANNTTPITKSDSQVITQAPPAPVTTESKTVVTTIQPENKTTITTTTVSGRDSSTVTKSVNKVNATPEQKKDDEKEKDPLALLKEKLDKVVYADSSTKTDVTISKEPTPQQIPKVEATTTTNEVAKKERTKEPVKKDVKDTKDETKYYVVKKGENATLIAKHNNITLKQLKEWNNNLNVDAIRAGQRLRIKP
jgi:hypothetical protein